MRLINFTMIFLLTALCAEAEEECVFDTKAQADALLGLQQQYKGSKVLLEQNVLEAQWEEGTVRYRRGGCVHFGESVTYSTSEKPDLSTRNALFKQAVKMTKEFFRVLVSGADIEKALQEGRYEYEKQSRGDYYSIHHDNESVISLGILHLQEGKEHTIEVGYYIN